LEPTIAGFTASLLTLFDLDRTFYVPARVQSKLALRAWWWCFIIANGLAAAALYAILKDVAALRDMNPVLKAIVIGVSYLALIRAKFTTFNIQGREVPFGLEALYEGAKGFVYKRINSIAKAARFNETTQLAASQTLAALGARARLSIEQDALMTSDDKRRSKTWLLNLLQDPNTNEEDKRAALADFILSGQRSGD
jgi:hypothetical protein